MFAVINHCPRCGAPIYMEEDRDTGSVKRITKIGVPTFTCQCRNMNVVTTPSWNPWVGGGSGGSSTGDFPNLPGTTWCSCGCQPNTTPPAVCQTPSFSS